MNDQLSYHPPSTLFTVRLWREALGTEPEVVCIQVKHVLSGETRYFRRWSQLTNYLEGKVQATKQVTRRKEKIKNRDFVANPSNPFYEKGKDHEYPFCCAEWFGVQHYVPHDWRDSYPYQ